MSGRPNLEEIAQLKTEYNRLSTIVEQIRATKKTIFTEGKKIENLKQSETASLQRINKLMDAMDVLRPGNSGYEQRLQSLLLGLCQND